MKSKYDAWGWFDGIAAEGEFERVTEASPGTVPPRVVGELYPNWTGLEWVALPYVEPEPLPEVDPAVLAPRRISVGAFFDRFGSLKWAILADPAHAVQAVVRDSSVRKFIDLDNPDLPAGLQIIVAAGHSINAASIITGAIRPEELP
jgi:hypothetical protein